MAEIRLAGHEITHDWTVHIREWAILMKRGDQVKKVLHKQACGRKDMEGVLAADALVWLYNPDSRGAFVELGLALAAKMPVYLIKWGGYKDEDTVFLYCDKVRGFDSVQEFLADVCGQSPAPNAPHGVCPICGEPNVLIGESETYPPQPIWGCEADHS